MNKRTFIQVLLGLCFLQLLFYPGDTLRAQERPDSVRLKIEKYIDQAWTMPYSQLDSAMKIAQKALRLTAAHQYELRFNSLDVIGQIYLDKGDLDSALYYTMNGLEVAQESQNDTLLAYAYNSLDVVYFEMKEYERSKEYALKTLDLAREIDMSLLINDSYLSLAIANYQSALDSTLSENERSEKYKQSKAYFEKSLSGSELSIDDTLHIYNNLSVLEAEFGHFETAIAYLKEVINHYEEFGDLALLANAYNNLGYIYYETGQIEKGEALLLKAWNLIKGKDLLIEESYIGESLYELYESKEDYEKALKYYKLYNEAEKKIYNKNTKDNIELLEQEYENQILTAENEKRAQQVRNQNFMIIGGVILLVLLLVILTISYYSRKKQNKLLVKLEKSNAELEKLNTFKDNILSIVSHDFRSPLSNLKTTIELSREDNLSLDDYKAITQGIDDQLTRTQVFLQNILLWAKKQIKGYQVDKSLFAFDKVVDESEELFEQQIKEREIVIERNYEPSMKIYSDFEIVNIVFRNIFQNAVKFSRDGERVVIKLKEENNKKIISVLDSGRGMNKETIDRLFSKNVNSTEGTQLENSTGIGLLLSRDLLQLIDADINVYSVVNQGSEFQIILPKA